MKSDGNSFNDFPEIVPNREITIKIKKIFSWSRPRPWSYFLNGPNATASIAPTLTLALVIRPHCCMHSVTVCSQHTYWTEMNWSLRTPVNGCIGIGKVAGQVADSKVNSARQFKSNRRRVLNCTRLSNLFEELIVVQSINLLSYVSSKAALHISVVGEFRAAYFAVGDLTSRRVDFSCRRLGMSARCPRSYV